MKEKIGILNASGDENTISNGFTCVSGRYCREYLHTCYRGIGNKWNMEKRCCRKDCIEEMERWSEMRKNDE